MRLRPGDTVTASYWDPGIKDWGYLAMSKPSFNAKGDYNFTTKDVGIIVSILPEDGWVYVCWFSGSGWFLKEALKKV